jgi:hypothetical protein
VVAWHPSWRVRRTERNPDNGRVQQVRFGLPLEAKGNIRVESRQTANVELRLAMEP